MRALIVLMCALSGIGAACAAGDPVAGRAAAIVCIGCHGADGNSTNPIYPKLAGQDAGYLAKQLADFKRGARRDEHMGAMVEAVDSAAFDAIAAFFASQSRTASAGDGTPPPLGERIYRAGIEARGVQACGACHGPPGAARPVMRGAPRLAGQHSEYLAKALKDFRNGTRSNDPPDTMRRVAGRLTDPEIDALAAYLGDYADKE